MPVAWIAYDEGWKGPCTRYNAFWLKSDSIFDLLDITALARVHIR